MGFGYIAAGLFFLFNPNINVFDFLPDVIGFLLIYHGLYQMSFSSPKIQDVRPILVKLSLIAGAHTLSIFLLPFSDGDSFYLVLTFVFAVLETMYLLPATAGLFEGFYDLGRKFDTDSVFFVRSTSPKRGKVAEKNGRHEGAESLRVLTVVFFLIKNIASVLPELTALELSEQYSSGSRLYNTMASFKSLFYGFCGIVVLIFGIIWLVRFLYYIRVMRRDAVLTEGIRSIYSEKVENNPALVAAIRMGKVRVLYICAAVSTFIFLLEGIDVIPNFLACAFLIAAFLIMRRYDRMAWIGVAVSSAASVLSLVNLYLQIPYFREYEAAAARHILTASQMYKSVRFFGTLEYVVMMAVFALAFIVFCRVMRTHASLINITGNAVQYSADARRKELLNSVYARIFGASVFGALSLGMGAAYFTLVMYYPAVFLVNGALTIIWIVTVVQAMSSSYENIYERLEKNF